MEGFTHLIPFAAGHEVIRQRRRDLTLIRMTPDLIYDQLIGAGCVRKLIFSWGGNPGVGSLHRFRDAVEHCWPARSSWRSTATRGWRTGTSPGAGGCRSPCCAAITAPACLSEAATIKPITCPFTGETLTAVAAIRPDVAIIHAQRADRSGNVQLWGITGVQKEAVLAPQRSVVTVEEIVDDLTPGRGRGPARLDGELRGARAGRGAPVLRAGLLRARQRLLRGLGRHRAGTARRSPGGWTSTLLARGRRTPA